MEGEGEYFTWSVNQKEQSLRLGLQAYETTSVDSPLRLVFVHCSVWQLTTTFYDTDTDDLKLGIEGQAVKGIHKEDLESNLIISKDNGEFVRKLFLQVKISIQNNKIYISIPSEVAQLQSFYKVSFCFFHRHKKGRIFHWLNND